MNKLKLPNNSCKGKSSVSISKDKTNNGVTKKLLQKYLRRKVLIGIERSSEAIEQTTNA